MGSPVSASLCLGACVPARSWNHADACRCRWYVIWRLLTEQPLRTIDNVYIHYGDDCCHDRCLEFDLSEVVQLWRDPRVSDDAIIVADSYVPRVLPNVTLVMSSPGRLADRALRDKLNLYMPRMVMPVPTERGIWRMRELAFRGLDEEGIRHRLKLWGAIPRLVLANVDRSFQTKARAEIESVPTESWKHWPCAE